MGHDALTAGDAERAIAIFAQAILAAPLDPHTHVNMSAAYLALDRLSEARAHAERATKLAPTMAEAHHNLGNALFAAGAADAALAAFARARTLDPDNEAHWTNYLFAQPFCEGSNENPIGRSAIFAENKAWGERVERRLGAPARPPIVDADPERVLELAYVLPELDAHVTPRFVAPLLASHDPARFRISLYGHRRAGGPAPAMLTPPGVRWIDTHAMGPAEVAARMRRDGIDVLIHPCTFKARYRLVLAHRAAPLQIVGINFVSTSGLSASDGLLCDDMLTPSDGMHGDSAAFFTERLLRLPSFNCYHVPDYAPPVAPLPALANGFLTFGSLNNPSKFGPRMLEIWAEVLRAVPTSRLLLKHRAYDDPAVSADFVRRFESLGVACDRLTFRGFTADPGGYLAAYHAIDVTLDSMPFNGGTTSYEAIWMGVPVLTIAGDLLMARQSASLMAAAGHPEFITNSKQAFVGKALALSQEIGGLARLRAGLRSEAARQLFSAPAYTRSLEDAVRTAWRDLVARPIDAPAD